MSIQEAINELGAFIQANPQAPGVDHAREALAALSNHWDQIRSATRAAEGREV